jgi:nucleoside-diphosphate-sugar epimerase
VIPARRWDLRPVIQGSNALARRVLDFQPTTSMDEGLEITIRWMRDNWDTVNSEASFNPGLNPALKE